MSRWNRSKQPPPPLFLGQKERDLVKQVNDEVIERIIGQQITYYPISLEHSEFHPVYGEAINKTFLRPIHVYALVEFADNDTATTNYGIDRRTSVVVHFHKRRLTEDQELFVREGDFVRYGDEFYELTKLSEPVEMFGQNDFRVELVADGVKARKGTFNMEPHISSKKEFQ